MPNRVNKEGNQPGICWAVGEEWSSHGNSGHQRVPWTLAAETAAAKAGH